jgi:hypothetical protein
MRTIVWIILVIIWIALAFWPARVANRRPAGAQVPGDLRHGVGVLADLPGRPHANPVGQRGTSADAGHCLRPRHPRAADVAAAPDSLTPHQNRRPPRHRHVT